MNNIKLEKNIMDMMEEQQLKLGYMKETTRLYYPLSSLNRFLETEYTEDEMLHNLKRFCISTKERLGDVEVSNKGERFCIMIPPKGAEYVHLQGNTNGFLAELIEMVRKHDTTIEEVLTLFSKYSSKVVIEKTNHKEFDYLVYFEDGVPDAYYYCITKEGHHVTYHRYTKEDYRDLGF